MSSPYTGAQPPAPATAGQQNHSLAFRVMRLSRPSLRPDPAALLRFDPRDVFLPEDALTSPDPSAAAELLQGLLHPPDSGAATNVPGDFTFRDRFLLRETADALAPPGLLVLPQAFGAIYLGETFCSYISINNSSGLEAREVIIKAEIQTERQRILLLDTSKSPVESIRSGGRYDFIVEHDVKELGAHTLVCTALYNDGDAERKYLPQFFKFTVSNPLSVRTKVRTIKDTTYLEACIENHTKSNLYMDQVDFEPAQQWSATILEADEHPSVVKSTIRDLCKQPILIRAGGGIYNYLYQLRPSSDEPGQIKAEGSSILGKFQITWRTNLGEPGRLQTQNIHSTPTPSKDVDLRAVKVPAVICIERPFIVNLCLTNQTEKTVGPFEVFLAPSISGEQKAVLVNGLQKLVSCCTCMLFNVYGDTRLKSVQINWSDLSISFQRCLGSVILAAPEQLSCENGDGVPFNLYWIQPLILWCSYANVVSRHVSGHVVLIKKNLDRVYLSIFIFRLMVFRSIIILHPATNI